MRLLSVFTSLIGMLFHYPFLQSPLLQTVAERDALVEHEAFAAPAALLFWHAFQIFQNSALKMINLRKAAGEQIRAGLFAADAAGAKHRDLPMSRRIELAGDEFLELPEAFEP